MDTLSLVFQIIIALGIFNVWLLRFGRSTEWRGGEAQNMKEEFAAYGLPPSFMYFIGALKLTLAAMLVVGIWVPTLVQPAAIGMAALMVGAIAMHVKVRDAFLRAVPAACMFALSVSVVLL